MNIRFIINPASGKLRRDKTLASRIESLSNRHDLSSEIVYTQAPGHATELASQFAAKGCKCVVSVGGDGTMNEVAKGLLNTDCTMGLIPCGSGNGLGRHLGITGGLERSMEIIKAGHVKTIDSGSVNGIPFFNVMGVGFDAEISQKFNPLPSRGLSAYIRVGLSTFFSYKPETYRFYNGATEPKQSQAWMLSIANSAQFGNNAYIAPGAQVDDGLLDLMCVRMTHLLSAIPLTARLFAGNLDRSGQVISMRSDCFTIERDNPGIIHTDGEVHETGAKLNIKTHPKSLKIFVTPELTKSIQAN